MLEVGGGNRERRGSLQYGGKLKDDLSYRVYVDSFAIPHDRTTTGADAVDGWSKVQGGFRLDWTPADDRVTLQGDLYRGAEQQPAAANLDLSGGNLQLNWRHQLEGDAALQLLAYYNASRRFTGDVAGYSLQTYDVELQHSFSLGDRQKIVWGLGGRLYSDQFTNSGAVQYLPARSVEALADVFAQDTVSLARTLDLTLGLKLEKDPYSGVAALPSARLSWKASDKALLWAAVSHAVRAPTLFDEDLQDTVAPGVLVLTGNHDFQQEKLTAYDVGGRIQLSGAASLSVSAFYNVYSDLRSVEWVRMDALPLLLAWGNLMQGRTYGVEVWGDYQPTDWWRLSAGVSVQHQSLSFKPGASAVNDIDEAGDDPHSQASLRSTVNLGRRVSWTLALRHVGTLPDPHVPAYTEMDSSLAWNATPRVQLSVSGANLLHARHLEYEEAGATVGDEIERSVFVAAKLRF